MATATHAAPTSTPLGPTLRARREEAGILQEDLAARAGISKSHLSRVESGERKPKTETYVALIEALAALAAEQRGAA